MKDAACPIRTKGRGGGGGRCRACRPGAAGLRLPRRVRQERRMAVGVLEEAAAAKYEAAKGKLGEAEAAAWGHAALDEQRAAAAQREAAAAAAATAAAAARLAERERALGALERRAGGGEDVPALLAEVRPPPPPSLPPVLTRHASSLLPY